MLSKIYNFLDYCYEDNSGDKLPNLKLQLFLIAVKSIMPYEDKVGCMFDYARYEKEIDLFKYYKNGQDELVDYYIENKSHSEKEDVLLEYKLIPLLIANTSWEILLNETLRAASFYSLNKKTLINTIIISSVIFEYLNQEQLNIEAINENTKERLINFSLKDFLNNNNIQFNKIKLIEFEKERISALSSNEIICDELKEQYKSLSFIYNYIKNDNAEQTIDPQINETSEETVLTAFSQYLLKLRKGLINPEKLKIQLNNIPDLKEFLKYTSFSHPLLGKCKVLKRGNETILKNKSGLIKVNI